MTWPWPPPLLSARLTGTAAVVLSWPRRDDARRRDDVKGEALFLLMLRRYAVSMAAQEARQILWNEIMLSRRAAHG